MRRLPRFVLYAIVAFALTAPLAHASDSAAPGSLRENLKQEKAATPTISADCTMKAASLPKGSTRVYIGLRDGHDGDGRSESNARDGSTVERFDQILRCYSEGCTDAGHPEKSVAKTENLIVCLGPGTFRTKGESDYVISVAHQRPDGFTIGKGWKIHGAGIDRTTVQLSEYLAMTAEPNSHNVPPATGVGVVFSTNSDAASGIEISDLTVDANYPALKAQADQQHIKALNLEAIHLRANHGGHWIHDVRVLNAAGQIGGMFGKWEIFPVWIVSVNTSAKPEDNSGNLIEHVTMSGFGGGLCTAIAVANAVGEVRNNRVEGYQIGYGGWLMGATWFHDNVAVDTDYGFNIDSLANRGVRIESTLIIHPRRFGIVVGGGGSYADFKITGNTIQMNQRNAIGIVFQGNVTGAVVKGNKFVAESQVKATVVRTFAADRHFSPNVNNVYEGNMVSSSLRALFQGDSSRSRSCFFDNKDENGKPSKEFADNHHGTCLKPQ
jgi:hypothetical protein